MNMATKEEIKRMKSIVSKNTRYFYEEDKDGNKVLRHILIGSAENILLVPSDGVTIDVVPENAVGSAQIINDTVEEEDLKPELRDKINDGLSGADRVSQEDLDAFRV